MLFLWTRGYNLNTSSPSDHRRDLERLQAMSFWLITKGIVHLKYILVFKTHAHTHIYIVYIYTYIYIYTYNIYTLYIYDMYTIMRSTSVLASWNGPWASPSQGGRLTISLVKGNDLGLEWRWWRQTNMIIVILFSVNLSCRCWLTQYHCGYWHFENAGYFSLHSFIF